MVWNPENMPHLGVDSKIGLAMTRREVINSVICVLFSFHASLLSGVSLDQPWSVLFLIKFVIFFRQEILGNFGIFFVTANSTNSAIIFSILQSWKKESLDHPWSLILISTNLVVFSNKTLAMLVDMWKLSKSWHNNYHSRFAQNPNCHRLCSICKALVITKKSSQ